MKKNIETFNAGNMMYFKLNSKTIASFNKNNNALYFHYKVNKQTEIIIKDMVKNQK